MFSLRSTSTRRSSQAICAQCLRHTTKANSTRRTFLLLQTQYSSPISTIESRRRCPNTQPPHNQPPVRSYATKTPADTLIEALTEQYATARDEFEIASEETEKKTVYAADDRAAAREELDKLKGMYEDALVGEEGEEVRNRVGHRLRELEMAVIALEESVVGGE